MSTTASLAAYDDIVGKLTGKRHTVFVHIRDSNRYGMTIDETCTRIGWRYSTTSARIFELAESGLICPRGDTRDGQTVWVGTAPDQVEFWRQQRREAKRHVDAKIVSFQGVGDPSLYGPEQVMRVTVEMTRAEWSRLKNTKTGRFA